VGDERGTDAGSRASAVDGQAAEEQRGDRVVLCEEIRRRRAIDRHHRKARIRDHAAGGVGDHPCRGGVATPVLSGEAPAGAAHP
jgi:hypothetical protein